MVSPRFLISGLWRGTAGRKTKDLDEPNRCPWQPDVTGFYAVSPRPESGNVLHILLGQTSCRTKIPRIFGYLSRILLRAFPESFQECSCFVSWETETWKNSPKIPAICQCKIPRQIRRKFTKVFWRAGRETFWVILLLHYTDDLEKKKTIDKMGGHHVPRCLN